MTLPAILRISWLTQFLPSPQRSGGDIASQNIIDSLRVLGHKVVVYGHTHPDSNHPAHDEISVDKPHGEGSSVSTLTKLCWTAKSLATRTPVTSVKFMSIGMRAAMDSAWQDCDLAIIDHAHLRWLHPAGQTKPLISVAHNIENQIWADRCKTCNPIFRPVLAREAMLLERDETTAATISDGIIALTGNDRIWFESRGATRVATATLPGLRLTNRQEAPPIYDVVLLGVWTWEPNGRGLHWFMDQVVPHLPAQISIAIGGKGSERLRKNTRIIAIGAVDDAMQFITSGKVHVIPSIAGGGVQIKTINALAMGIPAVLTTTAIRGIDDIPGHAAVADDPKAFAAAIVSAVNSPSMRNHKAGLDWQLSRTNRLNSELSNLIDLVRKARQ